MQARTSESGAVIVLVAVLFALMFLMVAVAIDIGWMHASRAELQHGSDSAALAAVFEIIGENPDTSTPAKAVEYAGLNEAARADAQYVNPDTDITIGYIDNPMDLSDPLRTTGIPYNNSIQVRTRMANAANTGPVPLDLFLGAFTGVRQLDLAAQATATIDDRIIGFDAPTEEEIPGQTGAIAHGRLLPFTLRGGWYHEYIDYPPGHRFTVNGVEYTTTDDYIVNGGQPVTVDSNSEPIPIAAGHDGKTEIRMYPYFFQSQPTNPNGNFGTLSVPPSSNSAQVRRQQIQNGVTAAQYEETFGDYDGNFAGFQLQGDPGLTEVMLTDFERIIGQVRYLLLHEDFVPGESGANALYNITTVVAVVIVDVVRVTGGGGQRGPGIPGNRYLVVQPLHSVDIGGGQDVVVDDTAKFGYDAPHSGGIFTYALTR